MTEPETPGVVFSKSTDPIYLAREAVLHHRGVDVLRGKWQPALVKTTAGPWRAEWWEGNRWPVVVIDWPDHRRYATSVCRVSVDDQTGEPVVVVCMTVGKAEVEWANADLIARMRTREPIIAAALLDAHQELIEIRKDVALWTSGVATTEDEVGVALREARREIADHAEAEKMWSEQRLRLQAEIEALKQDRSDLEDKVRLLREMVK